MKILRLFLKAFGPFTNCSLDLSSGSHGLHIVYGPNEAGKSSSLRAVTDLLYGFPQRTPDNFLHAYPRLRLGAELRHSDGRTLRFIRRKGNHNTLFDELDANPIEENSLAPFLGNVDREMFKFMFGIDHDRLRKGGEEIIKGAGRIGELLFSAGSGISELQVAQRQLNNEIEVLLKPSGQSGAIITDLRLYKQNADEVKQTQVTAETWNQLESRLRASEKQKKRLDDEIRLASAERNRLIRIRDATTAMTQWRKAQNDLAAVAQCPLLPEDFESQCTQPLIELRSNERKKNEIAATIRSIEEELATLHVATELLEQADAAEMLRERLGSYRNALAELPKLESKLEANERDSREILRQLGRSPDLSQIEHLQIPNNKKLRIQNLGSQKEVLLERARTARLARERLSSTISTQENELEQLDNLPNLSLLQETLESSQSGGDSEGRLRALQNEITKLNENAQIQITQLGLFAGSLEELEKLSLPSLVTIETFSDEFREISNDLKLLQSRANEKKAEYKRLDEQLAILELNQKVPTEQDLQDARQLRDQGWSLILDSLNNNNNNTSLSPEVFLQHYPPSMSLTAAYQKSVEEADLLADQLRFDADRVTTKTKLLFERSRCENEVQKLETEHYELNQSFRDLEIRWQDLWKPAAITPLSPLEMRDWFHRLEQITEQGRHLRSTQAEANALSVLIATTRAELLSILKTVITETANSPVDSPNLFSASTDEERTLKELFRIASSKIEEVRKLQDRRQQLRDSLGIMRSELGEATSQAREAEIELENWSQSWSAEMESLGLPKDASPSEASGVLQDLNRLFEKRHDSDHVRSQIDRFHREIRDFTAQVNDLTQRTIPALASESTENAIIKLATRIRENQSAAVRRLTLQESLSKHVQMLDETTKLLTQTKAVLDTMCHQAACESYDQLGKAASVSRQRHDLEKNVKDLEAVISGLGGAMDFDTFLQEVEQEALNYDTLQPRIAEYNEQIEELSRTRDTLLGQIEKERSELAQIDGNSKASLLSLTGASLAARLEEQIQSLAKLRLANAILHTAIEAYRQKNQGPILSRASEIFRKITLEGFSSLKADFNMQGERIITGVRSTDGEKVGVEAMSDGTCDQLYFALRLASLENWLTHHEPIPLIVDDVLLNFDNDRAIAILQVLGNLSDKTQVIFFTHHHHLVELARKNLSADQLFVTTL